MILTGGYLGEEGVLVISIFMVHTLYYRSKKLVIQLYIFIFSLYFGAEVFLLTKGSLFSPSPNSLGESIVFLMSLVWIWNIIKVYRKQRLINFNERLVLIKVLQEKNSRLEKTSAELEQFTYIASHDLKSPLRTIISFLGLIQRDISRKSYKDLLPHLDFARNGADQMNQLLQDILNYSKVMGIETAEDSVIDLNIILAQVKHMLKETLEKSAGEIISDRLPVIQGNEMMFSILLNHLIENGLKYNKSSRPRVCISSEIKGAMLILRFEDNGIGVEEQYFDKIFLLFKRLHTNVHYKGTGLGLGLCKKIIENMEGSITISSTINLGTTFTVKLPVKKVLSSPLKINKSLATAQL
jgi:light-regulated signal transduction histidine kinase (bacteriophytochrome)